MSEYQDIGAHELFRDEIMTHDIVLERMKRQIAEFNRELTAGTIMPGEVESEAKYEALVAAWPYIGCTAQFIGMLRPIEEDAGGGIQDTLAPVVIAGEARQVTSYGFEVMPMPDGSYKGVYLFGGPDFDSGERYYCYEDDVFSLVFDTPAPESIDWQIEHLVPGIAEQIKEAVDPSWSLIERIRGLDTLALDIDIDSFADYPIVERLATYLDRRVQIDHRIMHALTLRGQIDVEAVADDGTLEYSSSEVSDELSTVGYVAPISLAEFHSVDSEITWIARMTIYVHSDRLFDETDEEIGLWPESITRIESLHPERSLGRLIREHATLLSMPGPVVEKPEDIIFDTADDETEIGEQAMTYIEYARYLQSHIDAAISLVKPVAEMHFVTQEDAIDAAENLAEAVEAIFEDMWEDFAGCTLLAEGIGVSLPVYKQDGFVGELNSGSAITFEPDKEHPMVQNVLMDRYFVRLGGNVFPSVTKIIDDDGTCQYTVDIELEASLSNGGTLYRQAIPGTRRTAKEITVTDYVTISLDGSASLEHIDVFDTRQFEGAMETFKAKLEQAPDLTPLYDIFKTLQQEVYDLRLNPGLVQLQSIEDLKRLGEIAGGDAVASQLVVDTLSDLLGPLRIVRVRGKVVRTAVGGEAIEEQKEIIGVVQDTISLRPGSDIEEPMLYIQPQETDAQPVYVPLKDIVEFSL